MVVLAAVLVLGLTACSDDGSPGASERGGAPPGRPGAGSAPSEPAPICGDGADAPVTDGPTSGPVRHGDLAGLVPRPVSVEPGSGAFALGPEVEIVVVDRSRAATAACLLRDELQPATGLRLAVVTPTRADPDKRQIRFSSGAAAATRISPTSAHRPVGGDAAAADESYRIEITPRRVDLRASTAAGFSWAVQSLLQTADPAIASREPVPGSFDLPAGSIQDSPRYRWRGFMLDIARHWFGPAEIERTIDLMASYKLNMLHLHLTDDQGWRIQIRAYPELTGTGAATEVGGGEGGFLTQDQYRSLVAYAARRGVTVVPEIDMPGHTNAALASVPALNCDGQSPAPYTDTSVGFSSLCIGAPATEEFVDAVIGELVEMTPGPYIHIGGDESHATAPADYLDFVGGALATVRSHGRTPIGWDEIGRATPGPAAMAQYWLSGDNAEAAAAGGSGIIMSPASRTYLDMNYGPFAPEGNSWAGSIDTRTAYDWDPSTNVPGLDPARVVGLEAPLWTELVETRADIDHRLLPRLPALAEVAWSAQAGRRWDDFRSRIAAQANRWTAQGYSFTPDPAIDWPG